MIVILSKKKETENRIEEGRKLECGERKIIKGEQNNNLNGDKNIIVFD